MPHAHAPYTRPKHPPDAIQLVARDIAIMAALHRFGYMSLAQIGWLFFPGIDGSWARQRMRLLFHNHYVKMVRVVDEGPVFLLDKRGAAALAADWGVGVRTLGCRRRLPRRNTHHDLRLRDLWALVERDCREDGALELVTWVRDDVVSGYKDKVSYTTPHGERVTKVVEPDGFFLVRQTTSGRPRLFAFLVEVDMGMHSSSRFSEEKVVAGMAYLASRAYKARYGVRFGRWLVPTTSAARMATLQRAARENGGAQAFYFTTFDAYTPGKRRGSERASYRPGTALRSAIWRAADREAPVAIVPPDRPDDSSFFLLRTLILWIGATAADAGCA